jgi:hypothetical protein
MLLKDKMEFRAETLHSLQDILGAAKDVPPKQREVLVASPHPLDCRRRGEGKMGVEGRGWNGAMPGSALLNTPLDSPLNRILDGRLSSCEKGSFWGFPDFLASGKGSFYMHAHMPMSPYPLP